MHLLFTDGTVVNYCEKLKGTLENNLWPNGRKFRPMYVLLTSNETVPVSVQQDSGVHSTILLIVHSIKCVDPSGYLGCF